MKTRAILHVDMDAFYASVEERDHPELQGKPVIVGGIGGRGVVAAANYVVRGFGVRSAMPIREALRRCPQAICIAPRISHYAKISAEVFEIFREATPLVEGLSLDEAFLDVTASERLLGGGAAIAALIRRRIRAKTGLAASVGIAPNKLLAKIASDLAKPDGTVHDRCLESARSARSAARRAALRYRPKNAAARPCGGYPQLCRSAPRRRGRTVARIRQARQHDARACARHRRAAGVRRARGAIGECRGDVPDRRSRRAPAARGIDAPRGSHREPIARARTARRHGHGQDPPRRLQDLYAAAGARTRDAKHGRFRQRRLGAARRMAARPPDPPCDCSGSASAICSHRAQADLFVEHTQAIPSRRGDRRYSGRFGSAW